MSLIVGSLPLPGGAERLAWIPPGEDIGGFDAGEVHRGHVAVVRDVRVVVGQDSARCLVVFHMPDDFTAQHRLHAHV